MSARTKASSMPPLTHEFLNYCKQNHDSCKLSKAKNWTGFRLGFRRFRNGERNCLRKLLRYFFIGFGLLISGSMMLYVLAILAYFFGIEKTLMATVTIITSIAGIVGLKYTCFSLCQIDWKTIDKLIQKALICVLIMLLIYISHIHSELETVKTMYQQCLRQWNGIKK